ncbi:MAG: hypothetical protein N4A49_11145, partial [Marinifilaceae bacterium]|nr:hypothetical protein [Marinifilaceae bacterium]
NYYAGDAKVLVHNECAWAGIKQILVNSNKIELFDKFHDAVHALNIGNSERKLLFTSIANLGDNASKFILDFIDSPSKLSKFAKEAGLVEAWTVVKNSRDPELVKLTTNLDELAIVSKNLDEIKNFDGGYKAWKAARRTVNLLSSQIDNVLSKLKLKAKYYLEGTGRYKNLKGHHPIAKKTFEGDLAYDYNKAFSVSPKSLDEAWKISNNGIPQNIHSKITGNQNKLYSKWKKLNPNSELTIDVMAEIEIKAMSNAGIPDDIATGWVVKSLEDLNSQGVTKIINIPRNGLNK